MNGCIDREIYKQLGWHRMRFFSPEEEKKEWVIAAWMVAVMRASSQSTCVLPSASSTLRGLLHSKAFSQVIFFFFHPGLCQYCVGITIMPYVFWHTSSQDSFLVLNDLLPANRMWLKQWWPAPENRSKMFGVPFLCRESSRAFPWEELKSELSWKQVQLQSVQMRTQSVP